MFVWEDLAISPKHSAVVLSPAIIQLIATASVLALVCVCILGFRCWRRRRLRLFLSGGLESSPDGAWLVVSMGELPNAGR